jgi:hypothetical protein
MKLVKIERKQKEWSKCEWILVAYYDDGRELVFGTTPTESGSKRMLTRRAKQHGLKVNGDVAQVA